MSIQSRFQRHYPGPFDYYAGSDGVDDTFEIHCLTSGEFVIAYHYWEAREEAERTIEIITALLNDSLGGNTAHHLQHISPNRRRQFVQNHPGPYFVKILYCEMEGILFGVTCRNTGKLVVSTNSRVSVIRSCTIARHIAALLNQTLANQELSATFATVG